MRHARLVFWPVLFDLSPQIDGITAGFFQAIQTPGREIIFLVRLTTERILFWTRFNYLTRPISAATRRGIASHLPSQSHGIHPGPSTSRYPQQSQRKRHRLDPTCA